ISVEESMKTRAEIEQELREQIEDLFDPYCTPGSEKTNDIEFVFSGMDVDEFVDELMPLIQAYGQAEFTAQELVAWADEQATFTDAWIKTKDGREGYLQALRHLKHHVQYPDSPQIALEQQKGESHG